MTSTIRPTNALSPSAILAMTMHAQPGVYALLLGSGVSTGAGILTGWGVVKNLVTQLAASSDPGCDVDVDVDSFDAEAWWSAHGGGDPLGYSELLAQVGETPAARQGLLRSYFEPTGDERDRGVKVPGPAHQAVAELMRRGSVRVVVTTNFDRLIEHALEAVGVQAQVITRPEAVTGMTPLRHAGPTVIKLHGDYTELDSRNTVDELSSYPDPWSSVLREVFTEYGLLISGWSAGWDKALVALLESLPRRYPLYWDSRSSKGNEAAKLLASTSGQIIESPAADELFTGLVESLDALDRLAEPPLSTAMAVAQLKRYLPDPVRRIDVTDLVVAKITPIRDAVQRRGCTPYKGPDDYDAALTEFASASAPLLALLAVGVEHDDGSHRKLWGTVLDRLMALYAVPNGVYHDVARDAQLYPALLVFYAMSAAAIATDDDGVMIDLAENHFATVGLNREARVPAWFLLRPDRLLGESAINNFTRSPHQWQPSMAQSWVVREHLADVYTRLGIDNERELADDVDFRHALLIATAPSRPEQVWIAPLSGMFRGDQNWSSERYERLDRQGQRFTESALRAGSDWPWWPFVGGVSDDPGARAVDAIRAYDEQMNN